MMYPRDKVTAVH